MSIRNQITLILLSFLALAVMLFSTGCTPSVDFDIPEMPEGNQVSYQVQSIGGVLPGREWQVEAPEGVARVKVIPCAGKGVAFAVSTALWIVWYGTDEKMDWEPIFERTLSVINDSEEAANFAVFFEIWSNHDIEYEQGEGY